MCQFGDSSKVLEVLNNLSEADALIGYRAWYGTNPFNDNEKNLKSLNQNFIWPKKVIVEGNPTKDNSKGIYSYNYYNNYYYNYNNYNYYYNYNYKYYNYKYYNYYIAGTVKLFGKIFKYQEGYRSSLALPTQLVILQDKKWFEDSNTKQFANHFNDYVIKLAQEYDCVTIGYDDWLIQSSK